MKQSYVYLLTDVHGEVVYVGCTADLRTRHNAHRKNWWWEDVQNWRLIGPFADRERAERAERKYIGLYCPRYNTQGVPKAQMHALSDAENALAAAWSDYQRHFRGGRILWGEEALASAALTKVNRCRQRVRRERLTLLQGGVSERAS